jgi:hypothetical protein
MPPSVRGAPRRAVMRAAAAVPDLPPPQSKGSLS